MLKVYETIVHGHDARLVVLATGVCLLASYTAFSMMARLYAPRARYPWVISAAVVTGCGAWATHSIALLAFRPGVAVAYDAGMTLISGLIAVLGCGLGFYIARTSERIALGGAIVGFAIAAMHYVGMASVTFQAHVEADVLYFQFAALIGASFGTAALLRADLMPDLRGRIIGALLLTCGICGTHFIAISGLTITPDPNIVIPRDTLAIVWFSIALTAVVFLIVGLGVVANLIDQHIHDIETAKRDLEATLALAESANRAKSEFLATMSHELRTPLNAVIGFSEMIIRGHRNYKEYARDIHDSGSHLLQIINDILDLSKAESGNFTLSEDKIDCRETIIAAARLMRPRLQKAELALDLRLPDHLPLLWADGRLIKQLMLNLLSNAVKFTPAGGRIDVEVTADAVAGLTIAIKDTGVGIAKADLLRVRQPFVQVDSSLNRRHNGTGLGLPLVDMIMRQHGGAFKLESELGIGTSAHLLFPAGRLIWPTHDEDESPSAAEGTSLPASRTTAKAGDPDEKIHVLVVEDDRDLCDLLRRMLERAGFAAVGALNGREALRYLAKAPVDVLITDIEMPEMDGIELMRVLQWERPNLPVIALSGTDDAMEYGRIAGHLGARAGLLKPVEQTALVSTVKDVLARSRGGDDTHRDEPTPLAKAGELASRP